MITPRIRMYTGEACSFCVRAKSFLTKKGVAFEEIHIDRRDPRERERLIALTGRYTIPQIVIGDEPIGGWDDLKALDDAGRLDPMLGLA
jgi:glutaredoxin 3